MFCHGGAVAFVFFWGGLHNIREALLMAFTRLLPGTRANLPMRLQKSL